MNIELSTQRGVLCVFVGCVCVWYSFYIMRFFNGNFVKFTLGFIALIIFGMAGILLGGYYDKTENANTSAEVIK